MNLRTRQLLLGLLAATCADTAMASGDMTALVLVAAQLVLVGVFLFCLPAWRNWKERAAVSAFFFVPLGMAWLFTAESPYSENRGFISVIQLGATVAGWALGSFLVRARRSMAD